MLSCGTTAVALALAYRYHLGVAQTLVAVLISGGARAGPYIAWVTYRLTASQGANRKDRLAAAADELASMIRSRWANEAAMRRLNDPYPLPVSWISAGSSLMDSWDLISKLATSGAGWRPPSKSWGSGFDDLTGSENQLAETLARVPTGRLFVLGEPGDALFRAEPGHYPDQAIPAELLSMRRVRALELVRVDEQRVGHDPPRCRVIAGRLGLGQDGR